MSDIQVNLFNAVQKKHYLNVIYNDENIDDFDLFSQGNFNEIWACTYASSFKFLFEKLQNFDKAKIIIGEEDNARKFYNFSVELSSKFIDEVSDFYDIAEKISQNKIEFRYADTYKPIHSKIYLLFGSDKNITAMGSANFSDTAFSNTRQFEELVIYDSDYNPKMFEIFKNRFSELFENASTLVTPKVKEEIEKIVEKQPINVTLSNPDTKVELLNDMIENFAEKGMQVDINIQEILSEMEIQKINSETETAEIEKKMEILENITQKQKGKTIINVKKLKDSFNKIKEIIVKIPNSKINLDILNERNYLNYDRALNKMYIKIDEDNAVEYPRTLNKDELKGQLIKLNKFVETYNMFTIHKNKDYVKNVFEAVLFSFTSVFIYKIRQNIQLNRGYEKIGEIPIILILGGLANTGKSKLLLTINQMLGNNFKIYDYKTLDNRNKVILNAMFNSQNIFPILVDEVSSNLFKGSGEELIKSMTNNLTKPHPCLIGTTNIEFTAESQIIRRICYIHFDNPLPENKKDKKAAEEYFEKEIGSFNDSLFRHFLFRFIEYMNLNEGFYSIEDPLVMSRKIFRDIYQESDMEIPYFISDEPLIDYYKVGSKEWRAIYLSFREKFKEYKEDKSVFYLINLETIYNDNNKINNLKNKLPSSIIKSTGSSIIVYKHKFLEFIGVKDGDNFIINKIKKIFR